jgi:hypothetical protein
MLLVLLYGRMFLLLSWGPTVRIQPLLQLCTWSCRKYCCMHFCCGCGTHRYATKMTSAVFISSRSCFPLFSVYVGA